MGISCDELRFLLSKMTPKPSDKEIRDFLAYHESDSAKDIIFPSEVMEKMKDEILNPKKKGAGKKGGKKK